MRDTTTFIKLDRNITKWRWYHDANVFKLFVHLIIVANIQDHDFEDITVERGSLVTSLRNLSSETGLTFSQTRTALKKLEKTQEIAIKSHSTYTEISILRYDYYQQVSQTNRKRMTNESQQLKNNKNDKKGEEDTAHADSPRKRPMTNDEKFDEYIRTHSPGGEKYGQSPNGQFPTNDVIDMAEWKILG